MIFVYQCTECDAIMELDKGIQEPHPKTIPHCNCNGPVRHVFMSHGVHFRGPGFFKTDREMYALDKQLQADDNQLGEGLDVYDQRFGVHNLEEKK